MGWGQSRPGECSEWGKRFHVHSFPRPQRTLFSPFSSTWALPWMVTVASRLGDRPGTLAACLSPGTPKAIGFLSNSSALWRWALARQRSPRGSEAMILDPRGTRSHRCPSGFVPWLPGNLEWTARGKAQIALWVFDPTDSRLQAGQLLSAPGAGEVWEWRTAQSRTLSIRDKGNSGVHVIHYFSNFYHPCYQRQQS